MSQYYGRGARTNLPVAERVLRKAGKPLTVRQMLERAAFPTASKTPQTVLARDLSLHVKDLGDHSVFVRVERGKFGLREWSGGADPALDRSAP